MSSPFARNAVRIVAMALALGGLYVSFQLTARHMKTPGVDQNILDPLCTAFETSSCDEVLASKWAEININFGKGKTGVIPVAEIGQAFFTFALCWLIFVGPVERRRWPLHAVGTAGAGLGLLACVFLAAIMYWTLPKWCPLCSLTHALTAMLFVCMLLMWPRRPGRGQAGVDTVSADGGSSALADVPVGGQAGQSPSAIYAVVLVAAFGILFLAVQHFYLLNLSEATKTKAAQAYSDYWMKRFRQYDDRWQHATTAWSIAPSVPIVLEGEPMRGPATARHTLVVFSDFQCPTCAKCEEYLRTRILPASEKYGGLKVVFKHYPICPDCNAYAVRNLHPKACLAARAAEAARIVGGDEAFWKMHDLLFARNAEVKTADESWMLARGVDLGLDAEKFATAMNSEEAMRRIRDHTQEAENLGKDTVKEDERNEVKVTGTPALYLDYRPLRNWRHVQAWKMLLASPPPKPPAATAPAVVPGE